jgi:predicted branched-subunit amino acid permease
MARVMDMMDWVTEKRARSVAVLVIACFIVLGSLLTTVTGLPGRWFAAVVLALATRLFSGNWKYAIGIIVISIGLTIMDFLIK